MTEETEARRVSRLPPTSPACRPAASARAEQVRAELLPPRRRGPRAHGRATRVKDQKRREEKRESLSCQGLVLLCFFPYFISVPNVAPSCFPQCFPSFAAPPLSHFPVSLSHPLSPTLTHSHSLSLSPFHAHLATNIYLPSSHRTQPLPLPRSSHPFSLPSTSNPYFR